MIDGSNVTQRVRETIAENVFREVTAASGSDFGLVFCTYEHSGALNDDLSEQVIVRRLIEEGVGVVLGPASSKATLGALAAARQAHESQAVFISSSATADSLDSQPYFWRTAPANRYQVAQLKDYLFGHVAEGALTILYREGDQYAQGIALALSEDHSVATHSFDDTLRVNDVADAHRILFLSPTQTDVIDFLAQSAMNKTDYQILLTDSGANTAVFNIVRETLADPASFSRLLNRIRGTRPALRPGALPFDVSRELAGQRYEDVYYAFSFDAAWLAFHAAAGGNGLGDARSVAALAQSKLLDLTTHCDPLDAPIPINLWNEVHDPGRQKRCLRGFTGLLQFNGHAESTAHTDDDEAGTGETGVLTQAQSAIDNLPAEGSYEMWCPRLERNTVKLVTDCD